MDAQLILGPLKLLAERLVVLVPRLALALLALILGWVAALLLKRLIIRLLQAVRVDRLAEKSKLSELLRQGSVRLTFVELLGELAYWLLMIAVVIGSLELVGVSAAQQWLKRFGYFVPNVLLSLVILLFGMLTASFFGAAVRAASLNAGFPHGYLLGQVVHGTIVLVRDRRA